LSAARIAPGRRRLAGRKGPNLPMESFRFQCHKTDLSLKLLLDAADGSFLTKISLLFWKQFLYLAGQAQALLRRRLDVLEQSESRSAGA